jgi:general secretion pathway protein F
MMVFVLPQITEVFQQQHQQLPFLTRALLWASRHIIDYGFMILMMGGIVLGGFLLWVKSTSGQMTWHRYWALKSPVASLIREQSSSRFALTLSTLLAAQVPLVTALKQSATVINNSFLQSLIQQSSEKVQQGQSLSFSLGQTAVFPPLLVHLIANGEKTATLPQMLEKCAIQQEQMVKRQLHVLTTLLEPLMVVLFGGGVLILVLAILLPIIQLNNQI